MVVGGERKISSDKSKRRKKIIDAIHGYMDTITNPTTKAFWAYVLWTKQGVDVSNESLKGSKTIAKFAFGVGITSLAASLLSLGVSLLNSYKCEC